MTKIAPVIILAVLVPFVLIGFFFFIHIRFENVRDVRTPFECGFDPKSSARIPFSLRFFLLAVVFLIFDVEVALLFPLPYMMMVGLSVRARVVFVLFLVILLGGLFHEWNEGSLN